MNKPVELHITRNDLVYANRRDPCRCPVARSLNRVLADEWKAVVRADLIIIRYCPNKWQIRPYWEKILLKDSYEIQVPAPIRQFILEFDLEFDRRRREKIATGCLGAIAIPEELLA